MGELELQQALRSEAEARIREIWQAAEARVAARRSAVDQELTELRRAAEQCQAATLAGERRKLLTAAEVAVRQQQLVTEVDLLRQLQILAGRLLPGLCPTRRSQIWEALAAELPSADWHLVRVHPLDLELARQRFPAATIHGEDTLGGGLVAETADGKIVVDNSLAGRLARCWPELQTPLLEALRKEVDRDAAGSAPTR